MTDINQNSDQSQNNNTAQTEQAKAQGPSSTQGQAKTGPQWQNQQAPLFSRSEYIEKIRVAFLKGDPKELYNGLAEVPQQYNPQSVLHEALSQAEKPSITDRIRYRATMDWIVLASASALSAVCGVAGTMYALAEPSETVALGNDSEEGAHSPSVVDFQQSA